MANWNNPTLTSTYTNFVTEVKDRDVEAAVWFEGMSPTNLPTNAKRLNTTTGRFEKWNGTAWVDAVATFTFPALSVAGTLGVTGVATFQAGTALLPAITTTGDTNTGIFFPAADTIAFAEGGAESMRITSGGNLLIGTTTDPGDKLYTSGSIRAATVKVDSGAYITGPGSDALAMYAGSAERARIDASGNLGLGVTPSASWGGGKAFVMNSGFVQAFSSTEFDVGSNAVFNGTSHLYAANGLSALYRQNSGTHRWYTAPSGTVGAAITFTQAMTLDASGNLGVGTTSPVAKIQAATNASGIAARFQGGESNYTIRILNSAETGGGTINANSGAGSGITIGSDSGPMLFSAGGSERARIDNSGNLTANSSVTGHWQLPRGTTAQRAASPASGMIRFNTTLSRYEGHNGTAWSSIGGGATGGGTDDVFHENGQTVTTNYTLTTNKNAMSAGPITIASGITVTVPSGSNWVVV